MRTGMFISYRRADTRADARHIYDWLCRSFGRNVVFIDIDKIKAGDAFPIALDHAISRSRVMLVLIGQQWLNLRDALRVKRLDNPQDIVRLEIEHALQKNLVIIPVLLDGTKLPTASDLPASLASIVNLQYATVTHESFARDIDNLVSIVSRFVTRRRLVKAIFLAASSLITTAVLAFALIQRVELPTEKPKVETQPNLQQHDDGSAFLPVIKGLERVTRDQISVHLETAAEGVSRPSLIVEAAAEVKGILSSAQLNYSINDGPYLPAPLPDRIELWQTGIDLIDIKQISLKYSFYSGRIVGPFTYSWNSSSELRRSMKILANRSDGWLFCSPATCNLRPLNEFFPAVSAVTLSSENGYTRTIEMPKFRDDELKKSRDYFTNNGAVLFPANGADVKVQLTFYDGTQSAIQNIVPSEDNRSPHIVQLNEISGKSNAPPIFAAYSIYESPVWLIAFDLPFGFERVFYTFDDGGFLEAELQSTSGLTGVRGVLRFHEPKAGNMFRLKFRSDSGQEIGPFSYAIDWAMITSEAISAPASAKAVACRHFSWQGIAGKEPFAKAMASLDAQNALNSSGWGFVEAGSEPVTACKAIVDPGWVKVKEVEYGRNPEELITSRVKIDASALLGGRLNLADKHRGYNIWSATLPGKTSVYVRFVYRDEKKSEVYRVSE